MQNDLACFDIMCDIIRLQAALKLPLNLGYVDVIDRYFKEMYTALLSGSYIDKYPFKEKKTTQKIKTRSEYYKW